MPYQLVGIDLGTVGFYQAVAPDGAISIADPAAGGTVPVILVGDWIYITGDQPRVATDKVMAGAEGSSLVVQRIAASGSTVSRTRVIFLDGDSGWATLVSDPTTTVDLEPGQYVDCFETSAPYFGSPDDFDPDSTPDSIGIMSQVNTGRRVWRVA